MSLLPTAGPEFTPAQAQWAEKIILLENHALFWKQGTGKSKMTIETARNMYAKGDIDAVLVIAPGGVHEEWILNQLPIHTEGDSNHITFIYATSKAGRPEFKYQFAAFNRKKYRLRWMTMTYDSLITEKGLAYAKEFLTSNKVLLVLDESTRIKTPTAKRTEVLVGAYKRAGRKWVWKPGLRDLAVRRRILTGTPITKGPLDVYSQVQFLDLSYWAERGFLTFAAFKSYFCVTKAMIGPGGRAFQAVVGYRNLDTLYELLKDISSRAENADGDLPPKVYRKIYYHMSQKQQKIYDECRLRFISELETTQKEKGFVDLQMVLVRSLRLQQITNGFVAITVPSEDLDEEDKLVVEPLFPSGKNPRINILLENLADIEGKVIIFCRFTRDIDGVLEQLGDKAVRHDGKCSADEKRMARQAFKEDPNIQYIVGNVQTMGEGLNLTEANNIVYYSNGTMLKDRLQSEDRIHRLGQTKTCTIYDIVCHGGQDEKLLKAFREKLEVASAIQGDEWREWI